MVRGGVEYQEDTVDGAAGVASVERWWGGGNQTHIGHFAITQRLDCFVLPHQL